MKQYRKISLLVSFLAAVAVLPSLAYAAAAPNSFQALANSIAKILNAGAILMIAAALVVYFYNIVRNIFKTNQGEGGGDLRKSLWMGLLIIFVMCSIWGIIQVLQNSLFGGPGPAASNGVIIYGQ